MNRVFLGVSDFYDNVYYGIAETVEEFLDNVLKHLNETKIEDYYITEYRIIENEKNSWVIRFEDYFRGVPDTSPFQLFTLYVNDITEKEFFVSPKITKQVYV